MDALSQLYLDVNGLSKHLEDKGQNEVNYGLGFSYETRKKADDLIKSMSIGGYKNSYGDPSFYAGGGLAKRIPLGKKLYTDLGAVAGGITGYDESIRPFIMPSAAIGLKDLWKLRLMYGHKTDDNDALFMMNLGIPIK